MKKLKLLAPVFGTAALLLSGYAHASGGCDAFPTCGAYTCVNYEEGSWKDASGKKVESAYISSNDAGDEFQLYQTANGNIDGNVVGVLATCKH